MLRICCTLDFKPRFGSKNFFLPVLHICPFFPSSSLFCPPLSFSFLLDDKRTNERANERTDDNSLLIISCSSFAYHHYLFALYIAPLPFDTKFATTMTTMIKTTTMLMTTPPRLQVAQKGTFKNFKCKKHEETLAIFFRCTPLPLENLVVQVTNKSI
jgi:hypothetical protein